MNHRKLLLVLLLAVACWYMHRYEVTETRTWVAAGLERLKVRTQNGEIGVSAVADSLIRAVITKSCFGADREDAEQALEQVTISEELTGGELAVRADFPQSGPRGFGAEFHFTVPGALGLELSTSNGRVAISGIVGGIRVATSNGEVKLTDTRGPTEVATSNGRILVTGHQGGLRVKSSNGAIEADLSMPAGDEDADLETSNGEVLVYLPADASVRFDASTSNGRVRLNGFPPISYTRNDRTHKSGSIGEGASDLTIRTSNGDVTVQAR